MPSAQRVAEIISQRIEEIALLNKNKVLPSESHLVREAAGLLWEHQTLTAPGLTRHIDLTHSQAETLLRSLAKHGYAKMKKSRRGVVSASCTHSADELPPL